MPVSATTTNSEWASMRTKEVVQTPRTIKKSMTAQTNIEHFNQVVLITLDKLHDAFPVPIELQVSEVAAAAAQEGLPTDHTFQDLKPTFEAIRFLAKEGFLCYTDRNVEGTTFIGVQLTMKGLTILGLVPTSLGTQPSLISQVKTVLKSGAKSAATDAAKNVVSQLFTAALAAAPAVVAAMQP